MPQSSPLPLIDLSEPATIAAAAIDVACRETGFFAILNHGIDHDVIEAAWATTLAFFDGPHAEKMSARHDDPHHPYGFFPAGQEALAASLGRVTPPDLKESFNLAPPTAHADGTGRFGGVERIWPVAPAALRPAWIAYYDAMVGLSEWLLRLFAVGLGVDADYFLPSVDQHLSALRGIHYPALTQPAAPGQLRAGEHSDYGTLTILRPGPGTGGLEVRRADGVWAAIEPMDAGFVVNVGDMMARWTNDRWCSTRHRVAVPDNDVAASERRQSLAFFHQPNWDAEIRVIDTCIGPGEVAHEPVVAGPWLMAKFDAASSG